jgi:hypothetical protein
MTLSSAVETFEQLALDEVFVWDMFSIEIVNDWKINIGNDYITTGYNEYKQHKLYIYIWTHVKIQSFPKTPLASVQVAVKLLKGKMTIFGEGVSRPALFYTLAACYFLDDQIRSTFLCSVGGDNGEPPFLCWWGLLDKKKTEACWTLAEDMQNLRGFWILALFFWVQQNHFDEAKSASRDRESSSLPAIFSTDLNGWLKDLVERCDVGNPNYHFGMVYITHWWWFWGWFIIRFTTLVGLHMHDP